MADSDLAFSQQILNITQTQADSEVQLNGVFDDFWRKAVAFKAGVILAFCHDGCLEMRQGPVNLTMPPRDIHRFIWFGVIDFVGFDKKPPDRRIGRPQRVFCPVKNAADKICLFSGLHAIDVDGRSSLNSAHCWHRKTDNRVKREQ